MKIKLIDLGLEKDHYPLGNSIYCKFIYISGLTSFSQNKLSL